MTPYPVSWWRIPRQVRVLRRARRHLEQVCRQSPPGVETPEFLAANRDVAVQELRLPEWLRESRITVPRDAIAEHCHIHH